jgi:hypothetical protein
LDGLNDVQKTKITRRNENEKKSIADGNGMYAGCTSERRGLHG